ncbi:MAG: hypothetical protein ACRC2A_03445, partial [Enterobacterales bacterium]
MFVSNGKVLFAMQKHVSLMCCRVSAPQEKLVLYAQTAYNSVSMNSGTVLVLLSERREQMLKSFLPCKEKSIYA